MIFQLEVTKRNSTGLEYGTRECILGVKEMKNKGTEMMLGRK